MAAPVIRSVTVSAATIAPGGSATVTGTDTGGKATTAPAGSVVREIDSGAVTQTWTT